MAHASHTTMVPVSLAAYTHVSVMASLKFKQLWTTVGNILKQTDDVAISSYHIGCGNTTAEASVTDLLAKAMRGSHGSIDIQHEQLKYTLQWKAMDPFTQRIGNKHQSLSHHVAWKKVSKEGHLLWQAESKFVSFSSWSTAMSLQILQTTLGEEGPKSATYQLLSTLDRMTLTKSCEGLQRAMAIGASLGLMRTAAQERPGVNWQALSRSPLASFVKATLPSNDVFGSHQSESIIFRQQVLPAKEDDVTCGFELLDSMLITGGTGELGVLLCLQAASAQANDVVLTSRLGHIAHKSLSNIAAMKHTVIVRGDIACTDEARCCLMPHNQALPKAMMHAGTRSSRRSPKFAGHACLASMMMLFTHYMNSFSGS